MIWECMQRGMAAAGWVIGFAAALGTFAGACWLFCAAMGWAFGGAEGGEEDAGDADEGPGRGPAGARGGAAAQGADAARGVRADRPGRR